MRTIRNPLFIWYGGAYTFHVPETTGNLDWRPECSEADDRLSAVFLRPYILSLLQWSGLDGGALAHAGSLGRRYANLVMCPATPIGVGGRVNQPVRGGRTMLRHISARSEQTSLPNTLTRIHAGDRVRSVHAGRTGTAVKIYCDGSAAVCWDDGSPQPEGLAHERMPRALLELIDQTSSDRADQTASVLQIVAEALRTAALAPTLSDALDVAGAALNEIATIARGELPAARTSVDNDSFVLVHQVADETLHVFDRVASLLEAIERLACDSDDAIADLASMGRGLVAKQTDRVDLVFTCVANRTSTTEVRHG